MRNRMRRSCSAGSTWMSDARSCTAWRITRLTNLTIGASSTTSAEAWRGPADRRDRVLDDDLGDGQHLVVELVALVEQFGQVLGRDRHPGERLAQHRPQIVDGDEVGRVDHADDEPTVVPAQHGRLIASGEVIGEQRRQVGVVPVDLGSFVVDRSGSQADGAIAAGDDSGAAIGGPKATDATAGRSLSSRDLVGRVVVRDVGRVVVRAVGRCLSVERQ